MSSAHEDHTVPKAVTLEVFKMYEDSPESQTEYHEFAGRGHSLTIDKGWRDVADVVLDWLVAKNLGVASPVMS